MFSFETSKSTHYIDDLPILKVSVEKRSSMIIYILHPNLQSICQILFQPLQMKKIGFTSCDLGMQGTSLSASAYIIIPKKPHL